jgi:hypothetical protein
MTLQPTELELTLQEADPDARLDGLSRLVSGARSGRYQVSEADADRLLDAFSTEGDDFLRLVLWELLEFATPNLRLQTLALRTLEDPAADNRGEALSYLLRSYPNVGAGLLERFDADPDPFVQDALARFVVSADPRRAWRHWLKVLESPEIPDVLQEVVPLGIASLSTAEDWQVFQDRAGHAGDDSIWRVTADLTKKQLSGGKL